MPLKGAFTMSQTPTFNVQPEIKEPQVEDWFLSDWFFRLMIPAVVLLFIVGSIILLS
jgi:hypothetical protein